MQARLSRIFLPAIFFACSKTNSPPNPQPQQPASVPVAAPIPKPQIVEPESTPADPAPKLFRAGGTFYWMIKNEEKGYICELWTVKPDKKNSSPEVANGTMVFRWKDEEGNKATTTFEYSYFFVDKENSYQSETLPGFNEALSKGVSFELAESKYTKLYRNVWWIDLLGPVVESKNFGFSMGCAEGHPVTTHSTDAIKYGEALWFFTQKACDNAAKASEKLAFNAGC